jgi:putative oxidoreductase
MALAAGLAELAGGALFALGLLTPVAAALMIAVMVTAIATVHRHSGVWLTNAGFEYNLVLATVAFSVTCVGAGSWSLDHALALHVAGAKWGLAALAGGLLGGLVVVAARRLRIHGSTGATPARA